VKFLTWQNPGQHFVAQELIKKVKLKYCGIKGIFAVTAKLGGTSAIKVHFIALGLPELCNQRLHKNVKQVVLL
jgi:hypothetical protein